MPVPRPSPPRDVFLDVVRSVALLRVVAWHALGLAAITWFVSAVPAMFFVTGSLLAKSLSSRPGWVVVRDRLRRALIPLWVYGFVALSVLYVVHRLDGTSHTALSWRGLVWWVLPLNDPTGSAWEAGYLTAPLWYVRVLVWLFLLAPVLWWVVRRVRCAVIGVLLVSLLVGLEALAQTGAFTGTAAWRLGDAVLYAIFVVGGFAHRQGTLRRLSSRSWAAVAVGCGALAGLWAATFGVPGAVVNDSHVAHLLVGAAWLAAFFAARDLLVYWGTSKFGRALIDVLSQRAITVYLWHPAGIVLTYLALRGAGSLPYGVHTGALLAGTMAFTVLAIVTVGWIEDLANRRPARLWPAPRLAPGSEPAVAARSMMPPAVMQLAAAAGVVVMALASGLPSIRPTGDGTSATAATAAVAPATVTAASAASGANASSASSASPIALRVPSRQPSAPKIIEIDQEPAGELSITTRPSTPAIATTPATPTTPTALIASPGTSAELDRQLTEIVSAFAAQRSLPGIQVSVLQTGAVDWSFAQGIDLYGNALTTTTRYDIASATKSFTAALVWQAIADGLIDPDGPLPELSAVPSFPYSDDLTVRQLLAHRSGLVNYRATPQYPADTTTVFTAAEAVAWAGDEPLEFRPGRQVSYSSTNYLVLGFVLEEITGRSYDSLLAELLNDAGIVHAVHNQALPDLPNFSTSGLTMSATDLARWGIALMEENTPGLSDEAFAAMMDADPDSTIGTGLEAYCPCIRSGGRIHWTAWGYAGSTTLFEYAPASGVSVAVHISASLYVPDDQFDAVLTLIDDLRQLVIAAG